MKKISNKQKLIETIQNTKQLLSVEQPKERAVGQVWQIIPKNKLKKTELGVIIKHSYPP